MFELDNGEGGKEPPTTSTPPTKPTCFSHFPELKVLPPAEITVIKPRQSKMSVKGLRTVVTGGGTGIGRGIALKFAELGAR
jgi:hypothetical protein